MNAVDARRSQAIAYLRAHGLKVGLELGVNFLLPFAIYSFGRESLGDVRALMVASGPAIAWSVGEFIHARKVDALSILVLGGIGLSLLAFVGGGGVKVLQLRENLVAGLVGLVFLGSAAIGKPLIYQLARAATRRQSADKLAALDALGDDAGFRRIMRMATLVWGFGLLAVCAASCALVFAVSIRQYLLVSAPISYGAMGLMTLWTYWYVRRAKRLAEPPGGTTAPGP
jgi:hypothetical protein